MNGGTMNARMRFGFDDDQLTLKREARRFLETHAGSARIRAAAKAEHGFDAEVWRLLSRELGWTALTIPEVYGGLGADPPTLLALLEELGRALLPAPYFSTVVLAANALLVAGDEQQRRQYLPAIAAGELVATLAYLDGANPFQARPDGDARVLSGEKRCVLDGARADLVIVATDDALFLVPAAARGLSRRSEQALDATRPLATLVFDQLRVPAEASLRSGPHGALERILDFARIALSAEQVGGAERCLEMAVAYAKDRMQFGRPIGSFQAIKHKCAEILLQVESARSASYYAGWVAGAEPTEIPAAASVAKAYCSEAYFQAAAANLQIHGGIGFTWEHDAHLHLRRAKASELLFGAPAEHRERIAAEALGL
jgi:alkylation response protein AidB-like acyl-CoA dehydrogenase